MRDVRLQSGKIIKNVPDDISQSELYDLLIRNGKATPEDFGDYSPSLVKEEFQPEKFTGEPPEPRTPMEFISDTASQAGEYLKENLDVPGGIAGAVAGAKMGAPLGPKGILGGAVIGGTLGTFGGDLASSAREKEWDWDKLTPEDYMKAVENAALSAGIDIATIGLGRFGKPFIMNLIRNQVSPDKFIQRIAKGPAADLGTIGSKVQSQAMLAEEGASLTPLQLNLTDSFGRMAESFARTGIVSSRMFKNNIDTAKIIADNNFRKIFDTLPTGQFSVEDKEFLGTELLGALKLAKEHLGKTYDVRIQSIIKSLRGETTDFTSMNNKIGNWLRKPKNLNEFGDMRPELVERLNPLLETIQKQTTKSSGPASHLVDLDATILRVFDRAFQTTQKGSRDYAILSEMQKDLRNIVQNEIKKKSPEAFKELKAAKKFYREGIESLFPGINKNQVKIFDEVKYEGLGKLASGSGTPEQVRAAMNSIEYAYKNLSSKELATLPLKTAAEAKLHIKRGYLSSILKNSQSGIKTIEDAPLKQFALNLTDPTSIAKGRAILGDKDFNLMKKTANMLADVLSKPGTQQLGLAQRSAELSAAQKAMTLSGRALAVSSIVLGAPEVMARILLNPKRNAKLLSAAIKQRKTPDKQYITEALAVIGNDVIKEMQLDGYSDEDIMNMTSKKVDNGG